MMKDWYEMWNTNLITISLYTGKKMICALININVKIIVVALHKLIAITVVFHKWYQCGVILEFTTLHGFISIRLLRHFIP